MSDDRPHSKKNEKYFEDDIPNCVAVPLYPHYFSRTASYFYQWRPSRRGTLPKIKNITSGCFSRQGDINGFPTYEVRLCSGVKTVFRRSKNQLIETSTSHSLFGTMWTKPQTVVTGIKQEKLWAILSINKVLEKLQYSKLILINSRLNVKKILGSCC